MPLVTATFSTGGSVVITDEVEVAALAALTTAIAANTAMLEISVGPTSAVTAGTLGASVSALVEISDSMALTLMNTNAALRELNISVNLLTKQVNTLTTGVAHSVNIQAEQLTTSQMVAADQIKNNKFQQTNTNAALVDAGKEPIVVKKEDLQTEIKSNIKEIGTIKVETAATTFVSETVGGGMKAAATTSISWAAETAVGQFIVDQFLWVEAYAKSLFSDKTAKELYLQAKNEKAKAKALAV